MSQIFTNYDEFRLIEENNRTGVMLDIVTKVKPLQIWIEEA